MKLKNLFSLIVAGLMLGIYRITNSWGLGLAPVALNITQEDPFEKKVLDHVEKSTKTQAKLLEDVSRLSAETKKALEEVTTLKNSANDIAALQLALKKLDLQLRAEQRSAFGNPIERITRDDELRARFNAAVRSAVNPDGKFNDCIKSVKKALGEDSSPGSTLINDALEREIYDTLAQFGKWNTLGVRRLSSKITKYPVKTARPVANFILTEGGSIPDDTNKAGTSVNLEVEVIAALLNVSIQLLEDAEMDVTADVMDDFMQAYNERLDFAAFAADGTANVLNGGMTGVFNFGTLATAGATRTSVGSLLLRDFINCLTTVDPIVMTRQARWWMHPTQLARIAGIQDGNGRPLFQTALEAPAPGAVGSILGYPVELVMAAPSADGASARVAAFGDPQAMVVGVRRDYAFEASDQHRWNTLERSFRGFGRAGVRGRRATGLAILRNAAA